MGYCSDMYYFHQVIEDRYLVIGRICRIITLEFGVIGPSDYPFDEIVDIQVHDNRSMTVFWKSSDNLYIDDQIIIFQIPKLSIFDISFISDFASNYFNTISKNVNVTYKNSGLLILLTGLPGAGKSTLSNYLSTNLNVFHFDFSNCCHILFQEHPHYQTDYKICGEVFEKHIYDLLNCGNIVIYDTTSITKSMRQHHISMIPDQCRYINILVDTDPFVCKKRLLSERPFASPDLRSNISSRGSSFVRTFYDFCNDYEKPTDSLVYDNNVNKEMILEYITDLCGIKQ